MDTARIADLPVTFAKKRVGKDSSPFPKRLKSTMDRQSVWIWRVAAVSAILGITTTAALTMGDGAVVGHHAPTHSMVLVAICILSWSFAAIALVSAFFASGFGRIYRRHLERMEQGNYLAFWMYSEKQWSRFIEDEHQQANSITLTVVFVFAIVGAIIAFAAGGLVGIGGAILVFASSSALGWLVGAIATSIRRNKLRRWQTNPWFTVIGPDGLYYADTYFPYSIFGSGLSGLNLVKQKNMTYLVFTYYTQTKDGRVSNDHRIPVPYGQESKAAEIVHRIAG